MKLSVYDAKERIESLIYGVKEFIKFEDIDFKGERSLLLETDETHIVNGLKNITKSISKVSLNGDFTLQELELIVSTMKAIQRIEVDYSELNSNNE